jgi:hypothetical protein
MSSVLIATCVVIKNNVIISIVVILNRFNANLLFLTSSRQTSYDFLTNVL